MENYNNICFWRPGGVGDAVFAIPALQVLRRQSATIHFVGHLGAANLLKRAGLIDVAYRQSSRRDPDNMYSGAVEIAGRLGISFNEAKRKAALDSMGNPDLMVAFSTDPMGMSYALEMLSVPRYTVQYWQTPMGMHQGEFMVLALRNVGYIERFDPGVIDFKCDPPHIPYLTPSRTVVINPSAGLEWKRWPLERFVELASKLRDLGADVIILEGPGESHLDYKKRFIGSRVLGLSLEEVAGLLSTGVAFIGNDSGLTHLAAISGCPTIGLYGPTHNSEYGPIGPNVHVIRRCNSEPSGAVRVCNSDTCMEEITVHNVLDIYIRNIR